MAEIFTHNIDLLRVFQLIGTRKQNVTTAERGALGALLGPENEGLFVWDKDLKSGYTWDGAQFVPEAAVIEGDVVFRGLVDASISGDGQVELVKGYEYVVSVAGTLTVTGVTVSPTPEVEVGDRILVTDVDQIFVQQRNDIQATETTLGNVRIATQAEVDVGVNSEEVITPLTLRQNEFNRAIVRSFTTTINIPALNVPITVSHNLNLVSPGAFTYLAFSGNNVISLDIDLVDGDSIQVKSLLPLTGIVLTIQGASVS